MSDSVIILGAGGRFGRAATKAFLQKGWQVNVLRRSSEAKALEGMALEGMALEGTRPVHADIFNVDSLVTAVQGCDVIVNALNPPYQDWSRDVPRITHNVIKAAITCSATVMIPGNVYNYGEQMPERLIESTPHEAVTKKGLLRIQMEQQYAEAAEEGLQSIVLRGGDFIEKNKTGNWFDSYVTNRVQQGVLTYPGPLDKLHAWAYLPDMANAMVALAEIREHLASFEEFGFEGFNITGQELIDSIEMVMERPLKIKKMPWLAMKLFSLVSPAVKEVIEMRYLWQVSHAIEGSKLKSTIPGLDQSDLRETLLRVI